MADACKKSRIGGRTQRAGVEEEKEVRPSEVEKGCGGWSGWISLNALPLAPEPLLQTVWPGEMRNRGGKGFSTHEASRGHGGPHASVSRDRPSRLINGSTTRSLNKGLHHVDVRRSQGYESGLAFSKIL